MRHMDAFFLSLEDGESACCACRCRSPSLSMRTPVPLDLPVNCGACLVFGFAVPCLADLARGQTRPGLALPSLA